MSVPPKRDKFAALAAAQGARPSATLDADNRHPSSFDATAISRTETSAEVVTSGRSTGGKFAALQKANATKRDKFSALASRAPTVSSVDSAATTPSHSTHASEKVNQLASKCRQRDGLWESLEEAEVHVLEVLGYAQQTVECFAHQTTMDAINPSEIQKLSSQVQRCIQLIHSKLAPTATFIQAYRAPERINKLYQIRVEEGLAIQKEQVLKDLVELEKSQNEENRKRKREE